MLNTGINKAIHVLVENTEYSKTVTDGKIIISLFPWRPFGIYYLSVSVENVYIWNYIANFVWHWVTINADAANCNASDVTFSGDRGSGLTITITNANIKEDNKVIVSLKSINI